MPPDSPATPAPISAGVLGMARTTTEPGGMTASSRADEIPATIDSTRRAPLAARVSSTASATSGLTASTTSSAPTGPDRPRSGPGWAASRRARWAGPVSLTTRSADRGPSGREQAGEQGGTHLSATDQEELGCHARTLAAGPDALRRWAGAVPAAPDQRSDWGRRR